MKKNVSLTLPKKARIPLIAVGAVLVLALGWMVVLSPKQKEIANLNAQTAAVRQQIADDLSRAASARGVTSAPTIKTADVYKLATAMPSITDMPDLLLELNQTAQSAGVSLDSIQPGVASDTGLGYSSIGISLAASGNFYALTDLIYRLRNLVYVRGGALQANGRIFTINNVTLAPSGKQLSAQISLTTYVYGASGSTSAAAGTSTTGTTTTSTTTTTTSSSSSGPSATGAP